MKIFTNETKEMCADEIWITHKGKKVLLPLFYEHPYHKVGLLLDSIAGVYKLYECRILSRQGNSKSLDPFIVRAGSEPQDTTRSENKLISVFKVECLHDNYNILKLIAREGENQND